MTFREIRRDEIDGLVFATSLAFRRVFDAEWSVECARNFVMGLLDGEVTAVFDFARELIASPTRAKGISLEPMTRPQLFSAVNEAAALATIVYVDTVTKPDNKLHRWAILLAAGVPENVLRTVELEGRKA